MKGNTLYVTFHDKSKEILQPYLDEGLITVGWDYEWIINGDQEVLDEIASKLKKAFNWSSFHIIENNKIVWY